MIKNKKIYILHEYDSKSHFEAIYKSANDNKISIEDYVILSRIAIIKRLLKSIIKDKSIFKPLKKFMYEIKKTFEIKKVKDSILIVGIAPYNRLLNRYEGLFNNNKCIYFTSWQDWSGNYFPRGTRKNKDEFERILKEHFDSAACVTKRTEEQLKNLFEKSQVVNHSICIDSYKKKELSSGKNQTMKFLYLGQLIERKNVGIIFEFLRNNNSNIEIYFAGDGKLTKEVIARSQSDKRIKYLGKLSKNEIKNTLKDYDFLILPSKDEPFGIVLIEALASGVPCIVSDCYGPKEIITDNYNGYVFDRNDLQGFLKAMDNAITLNDDEYNSMVENSISSSKKYNCDIIFEKWCKLLY